MVQDTIEILQLQYTDKVVDVCCAGGDSRAPTVAARRTLWTRSLTCPLGATTDAVVDVLAQFIDGCGRPCDHAATFFATLEVPQLQFIAGVGGHSSL